MAETRFHISVEPCAIVQAESWPATSAAFEAELSRQLGGKLPSAFGEAASLGSWQVIRLAPRRFWFVADAGAQLRCSVDPELGCLLPLSEGRQRLRLSGPHTFDVLAACVAIDWRDAKPGHAFQTSFHHVPVLLLRTAADACEVFAPRSFAQSLAERMADAVTPYQAHDTVAVTA